MNEYFPVRQIQSSPWTLWINSPSARLGRLRDSLDVEIAEIRWRGYSARIQRDARHPPVSLYRETRPFLNRARTLCLFKFPTRVYETFAFPLPRPPVLRLCQLRAATHGAEFTSQYFTGRNDGRIVGWMRHLLHPFSPENCKEIVGRVAPSRRNRTCSRGERAI